MSEKLIVILIGVILGLLNLFGFGLTIWLIQKQFNDIHENLCRVWARIDDHEKRISFTNGFQAGTGGGK